MGKRDLTFRNLIRDIFLYITEPYCNCIHCTKKCIKHDYCKSTCIQIDLACKKDLHYNKNP